MKQILTFYRLPQQQSPQVQVQVFLPSKLISAAWFSSQLLFSLIHLYFEGGY